LITHKGKVVANAQYKNIIQSGYRGIGLDAKIYKGLEKIPGLNDLKKVVTDYFYCIRSKSGATCFAAKPWGF